ncbi:MAG: hypothetical protein WC341_00385 [Bacteroidales bacterium]
MDDSLIDTLITASSRAWDRKCTGVPDAVNYFASGSVVGEVLTGQIDHLGQSIICYPHKPIINSVSAFSYQSSIIGTEYTVDPARIDARGPKVVAYPSGMPLDFPAKCRIKISYVGGLGATLADLPDDMVEAVTILAIRFYREAETGLVDQIGVAELATMVYTKAWPVRVTDLLQIYKRRVGWRYVA